MLQCIWQLVNEILPESWIILNILNYTYDKVTTTRYSKSMLLLPKCNSKIYISFYIKSLAKTFFKWNLDW